MFDIGGTEFLFILVIALVVIGPKDLPGAMRSITGWIRKARNLAQEFQGGMDDLAREVEIDKITDEIKEDIGLDEFGDPENSIRAQLENTIDPDGEITGAMNESRDLIEDDDDDDDDELTGYDFDESDLSGDDEKEKVADAETDPNEDKPADPVTARDA
jgi:sec-independent protein translocase protein TatB